jgi:hypothetical protein
MKRYVLTLLWLFSTFYAFAQSEIDLQVLDKSQKGISYATVILKSANFAFNTDIKGQASFRINDAQRDTLLIIAQGFEDKTIPLPKGNKVIEVKLNVKTAKILPLVNPIGNTPVELNARKSDSVIYFVGLSKKDEQPDYLQYAQQFSLGKTGATLESITIHRLILGATYDNNIKKTMFRLRFYGVDLNSGAPKDELTNEMITVVDSNSKVINVNLRRYKINIPNDRFFVAIEVLRIPFNEQLVRINPDGSSFDAPPMTSDKMSIFQPFPGLTMGRGVEDAWVLTFQNRWKRYQYFPDSPTGFAISAKLRL